MERIRFEFKLPNGPKCPIVIVAGGADADRNGKIENKSEIGVLYREDQNTWTREQRVSKPTSGTIFAVSFTVGVGVVWSLTITDSANRVLYSGTHTTAFPSDTVSDILS
jgi:hypothetical protein